MRNDFVTNSSSTAFIITNKTNERKTLVDFVKESPRLMEEFLDEWGDAYNDSYTLEALIKSAEENNTNFDPKESKQCIFGDEDETLIGGIFDYALREGGESESFKWKFDRYFR